MNDMNSTIIPKSDQLNSDDLIGGRILTIKITKMDIAMGEQPVAIHYEGDGGKPYKPGKSMRRVLVNCWGSDANKYVGRSLTLYRDEKVKFGGVDVGGIRISHLSHIDEPKVMALTATRAIRKPFMVKPLIMGAASTVTDTTAERASAPTTTAPSLQDWLDDIAVIHTLEGLKFKFSEAQKAFKDSPDFAKILEAKNKRKEELTPTPDA